MRYVIFCKMICDYYCFKLMKGTTNCRTNICCGQNQSIGTTPINKKSAGTKMHCRNYFLRNFGCLRVVNIMALVAPRRAKLTR